MAASRFLTLHGWSIDTGAPSTHKCAITTQNSTASSPVLQRPVFQRIQNPKDIGKWEHKKATLQSAIEQRRQNIETLKSERKAAGKHIAVKDLPEEDRFSQLRSEKKHFIDTIKLIAYRAETAMAGWRANTWRGTTTPDRSCASSTRPLSTSYPTRKARH